MATHVTAAPLSVCGGPTVLSRAVSEDLVMRVLFLAAALALAPAAASAQTLPVPEPLGAEHCSWMNAKARAIEHAGVRQFDPVASDNGGVMDRRVAAPGATVAHSTAIIRMTATDEDGASHSASSTFGHTVGTATARSGHGGFDCTIGGSRR